MKPHKNQPYIGLIAMIALRHWRRLPAHVAAVVSVDDMVDEVLLHLVTASRKYNPKRGASPVTFVHWVAENQCRTLVKHHLCARRFSPQTVPWTDMATAPDRCLRYLEARATVERMLADASVGLRRALQAFLRTRRYRDWEPSILEEVQALVAKHHVSYGDLWLILNSV